ncbi:MAG TPA: T9SS type A sorting domain-containing protein, partial [Bacteroidia bacterium]|nr:T9SS type A sorting domain-containing protein [Bacteroidia bacterium]
SIPTTTYYVGSNALQLGSSQGLDLRDIRMLSAFYLNGIVHCVFHSKDPSTPYNGINYNRIDVSAGTNQSSMLSLSGYDYSYPAIASFATTTTDKSVMIGFLRSGSSIYPQERVVNCDNGMVWSGSTLVKAGLGPVTGCYQANITANRWGDYTRIARKNNSSAPSVWMSAQYGEGTNSWATWIAEIHGGPTGIAESAPENNLNLYPNPVSSNFVIEFTLPENTDLKISIIDAQGKLVKELFKGTAIQGENIFSFNKSNLSQGIYFLIIQNNKETIKNEKIIVTD